MKKICVILFIGVFLTLVMFSGCKKKLPTQPDISTKILPTIEYFTATPESISPGELSILSWSVKNATNITIDHDVGTVSARATTEVSPEETTTYTLTATNSDGQKTQSCKVEVTSLNLPIIDYFIASPESIMLGEDSTLSWSVQPEGLTEALRIEPLGDLTISWEGSHTVSPTETTTYTLIATNSDGQIEASCTVEVTEVILNPPTIEYFTATPESINQGDYSMLSWSVTDATTLIMEKSTEPGSHPVPLVGTQLVSPIETITYTLTATNGDGEATASCTIEVILNPPIIEYFIANPTSIKLGDKSELSWSVTNADTRIITQNFDPAGLDVDPIGTYLVGPTVTTIFTLTATNDAGQTTSSCEVEILPRAMIELSWVVIHAIYYEANLFEVVYEFDMQESGGVGGQINELAIKISDNGNVILDYLPVASFEPSSTFSHSDRRTMYWQPKLIKVWVNGVDDNGYKFSYTIDWRFSW